QVDDCCNADLKVLERNIMKKTQGFIGCIVFLLCAINAIAQDKAVANGAIVEQIPCTPNSVTHEQFVERFKARQLQEVESAKAEGVSFVPDPRLVSRLPNKDEYDRRVAYAGFECLRIKYLSD